MIKCSQSFKPYLEISTGTSRFFHFQQLEIHFVLNFIFNKFNKYVTMPSMTLQDLKLVSISFTHPLCAQTPSEPTLSSADGTGWPVTVLTGYQVWRSGPICAINMTENVAKVGHRCSCLPSLASGVMQYLDQAETTKSKGQIIESNFATRCCSIT